MGELEISVHELLDALMPPQRDVRLLGVSLSGLNYVRSLKIPGDDRSRIALRLEDRARDGNLATTGFDAAS